MRSIRSRIHVGRRAGSVAVEYAIFFPLVVVVLVLFLIQLSWVGFQSGHVRLCDEDYGVEPGSIGDGGTPDLDAFVADGIVRRRLARCRSAHRFPCESERRRQARREETGSPR